MRASRWSVCFRVVMLIWKPRWFVRLGSGCHDTEFRLFLSISVTATLDEAVAIATRSHPS